MLSLDGTQTAIVAATNKDEVSWLFEVDANGNGSVDYRWSTKAKSWGGNSYTFKVIEFTPPRMQRGHPLSVATESAMASMSSASCGQR